MGGKLHEKADEAEKEANEKSMAQDEKPPNLAFNYHGASLIS